MNVRSLWLFMIAALACWATPSRAEVRQAPAGNLIELELRSERKYDDQ